MRLGGEDSAWLHMEDAANPMVINSLLELSGTLDLARLAAIIVERGLPPRFRARVVPPEHAFALPRLEPDEHFDLGRHVFHVEIEPGDEALRAFVRREIAIPLERDRPLWKTIAIDRTGGPTAVMFRVHHAIGDGYALLAQLLTICDEGSGDAPAPTHGTRAGGPLSTGLAAARLVGLPPDPHTTLKNCLGIEKDVAWSREYELDEVKTAARAMSATVNDLLVAAVAGGIGRYLRRNGEAPHDVRAMVPVNLRRGATTELGNRFGLVILALPVGIRDPLARLDEVKRRMDRLKATPEAWIGVALLGILGHLPLRLEALGARFFATKTSLVLTNVPGPRTVLHLGGVPIRKIVFWVPEAARLGLGVSIFSYAGKITLGVVADVRVAPHPEALVAALDDEMNGLLALQTRARSSAQAASGARDDTDATRSPRRNTSDGSARPL